ncbi:MAG: helix-turn-helix transcriptional regulator [Aminipila sp.]
MNTKLRLKEERLNHNWTQSELAEKLGVSKQAVCDWEKGRRFPRRNVLLNLEKLFNLSHQELFAVASDKVSFSSTN